MTNHSSPHATQSSGWFGRFFSSKQSASMTHKANTPSWYGGLHAYMHQPGHAVWSGRDYTKFAEEAYRKNVVANRAISMIARGVATMPITLSSNDNNGAPCDETAHPLSYILHHPNPMQSRSAFLETLTSYYLLSGNCFVHAVGTKNAMVHELYALRPDRMQVVAGRHGIPQAYHYKAHGQQPQEFRVDAINGLSRILHIKHFHPLHDWHGMAPAEAAAYSIDQHNQAAEWNQSLLQNGARPSGALVMKMGDNNGHLTEDQYYRLKQQVDEQFSGARNAGRPLLLEGGLEWEEMSLNPRDMDFLNIKHSSARDIALAFGVPPQLLGIPGDNTYANLAEARMALWEQTIIPVAQLIHDELLRWLNVLHGSNLHYCIDMDAIPALAIKRERLWQQLKDATFLSDDEKRNMLGITPLAPSSN